MKRSDANLGNGWGVTGGRVSVMPVVLAVAVCLCGVLAGPAFAAPQILPGTSSTATEVISSTVTQTTETGSYIAPAGKNRVLVLTTSTYRNISGLAVNALVSPTTLPTWNGYTFAKSDGALLNYSPNGLSAEQFYAAIGDSDVTQSATLTVTYQNAIDRKQVAVTCLGNIDQASPLSGTHYGANANSGTVAPVTSTAATTPNLSGGSIPGDFMVVDMCAEGNSNFALTTNASQTNVLNTPPPGIANRRYATGLYYMASSGTKAMAYTLGTAGRWNICATAYKPKYSVNATAGAGGTLTGWTDASYDSGAAVSITATPSGGYSFTRWEANTANQGPSGPGTDFWQQVSTSATYTFNAGFKNEDQSTTLARNGHALRAVFAASGYVLTFDPNGSGASVSPTSAGISGGQTYGQGTGLGGVLPTPTRSGYNFLGWFPYADGTGTEVLASTTLDPLVLTLYAKWAATVSLTVTANAQSKTYDNNSGTDPVLTYTVSPPLDPGDNLIGTLDRAAGQAANVYIINQGALAAPAKSKYTIVAFIAANFTINARPLTVTADPQTKVYGASDPALTYTLTGSLVSGDSLTGALARAAGNTVVGSPYAINQGTLAASANYAVTFVPANLTITAKPLTVTVDAKTKVYGASDPALTYVLTGALETGDSWSGALARTAGNTVAGSPYAINQATLTAGTNYAITFVPANLTITAKPLTVTADAKTKVYGASDPSLTYVLTGALETGDSWSGGLARAAGNTVAGSPYTINQGTLTAGTNYAITFVAANFTITAKPLTVTADPKTKVYGAADPALTYVLTGALETGDSWSGALARTAGTTVAGSPYAINQGTLTAGTNYSITYVAANLTITAKPITVTADVKTKVYGASDPALTYTLTGALETGDSWTGALARAAGSTVVGSPYAINQGTLTAGSNYTITFVPANFTITAKPLTVTVDAKTKVYGAADPALTYVLTGTLETGDSLTGSLARAAGNTVVGSPYAINQGTLTAGSNYAITFVPANLTITAKPLTVTAVARTKVYGAVDPTLTYTVGGTLETGDSLTGALGRAAGNTVAGSPYAINLGTLTAGTNYAITFVAANLTITAKPLTVTAAAKTKVYGAADPVLTYTLTTGTLETGDSFTGALARAAGNTVAGSPYAINQGTLTAGTNYSITYVAANLTITAKPITVTADAKTKVYGAADPALTYTLTTGTLETGDSFTGALARAAGNTVAGGPYAINQGTLTAGTNYSITYVAANLTITAKPITVTADAKTKVYGASDPALTYTLTSGTLETGDSFTGALARAAGNTVAGSPYAINQGTLTAGTNYAITFVSANLTVTTKSITVTADAKTKVYGASDPVFTYTLTGTLETGDSFTGALGRAAGTTVVGGPYAINQGTLTAGTSYAITFVPANLTITAKLITVTADAKTKPYGASDPALTYTLTGTLETGDSFSGALGRAPGDTIAGGPYAINQGTLTAGSNYSITFVPANFTVTPKALTVSDAAAVDKTYDGNSSATFTGTTLVGVISPDVVTVTPSATGTFASKNVAKGIAVTATGLWTLGGPDAANYTVTPPTGLTAEISAKPVTVGNAAVVDKPYDGNTSATFTGTTLVGIINPDIVTATPSATGTFASKDVANGIAVTATGLWTLGGADGGNYTLTQPTGLTGNITPKALTVSNAAASGKVYDGTTATTVSGTTLSGVVSGDTVTVTAPAAGTFASKNVANGIAVSPTGTWTLGAASMGNYTLTQPTGLTANITPKAVTVTIVNNPTKQRDGNTIATLTPGNFLVSGLAPGESITVTQTVGTYASPNTGVGIAITASLPGKYVAGPGTSLSNYTLPSSATGPGAITDKALPSIISWPSTATEIFFGQPLSASTLGSGQKLTPGSFGFTAPGTLPPNAGVYAASVTFTPTDQTTYSVVSQSVNLTVNKTTPTLTAPTASDIVLGQTLSASVLGGGSAKNPYSNAAVAGTFVFTTPSTAPAGTALQSVTFIPQDTLDYNTATVNVSVTVNLTAITLSVEAVSPLDVQAIVGGAATLEVRAVNATGTPQFAWYMSNGIGGWTAVTGGDLAALVIDPAALDDSGQYKCVVSDNLTVVDVPDTPVFTLTVSKGAPVAGLAGLAVLAAALGLGGAARQRRRK